MNFNQYQNDVIELNKGVHACLAAAGSGKTEVLTERLIRALKENVDPNKMLCLTFTNRAALSMQERVKSKLGEEFSDVFIGNTHALALNILQESRYYPFNYSLCTADVSGSLWKLSETLVIEKLNSILPQRLNEKDSQVPAEYFREWVAESPVEDFNSINAELFDKHKLKVEKLEFEHIQTNIQHSLDIQKIIIPNLKSDNFNKFNYQQIYGLLKPVYVDDIQSILEDAAPSYLEFVSEKIQTILETESLASKLVEKSLIIYITLFIASQYESIKKHLLLYDFDDALCDCMRIPSRLFEWVQIDECQDLSPIQWKLLSHHTSQSPHIIMFGDINQSIYRFLGASVEVTTNKLGNSIKELPINYRSPQNLVDFFSQYMKANFPNRFSFNVTSNKPPNDTALIWVERQSESEQMEVLYKHAKKLAQNGQSTAFLCSTNRDVQYLSDFLRKQEVEHFRVSQNDILTSKNALDFFAFIKAYSDGSDTLSWSRLLWNFGNVSNKTIDKAGAVLPPQIHALQIVSELSKRKAQLIDILSGKTIYEHMLRKFELAINKQYVYFDTETTGLNEYEDNVIQLAAVRLQNGMLKCEVDLYCLSNKSVGESAEIHKITDEIILEKGKEFNQQISKFFELTKGTPIIAHNLKFDLKMLHQNILRNNPNKLLDLESLESFCSLNIARRLFPNLKSHKLGDLLEQFELEGVNSHNALDDVKAGASLVEFIKKNLSSTTNEIDSFLNIHEGLFSRFKSKVSPFFDAFKKEFTDKDKMSLSHLFDFYFGYISDHNLYSLNTDNLDELRLKLINWSNKNIEAAPFDEYISSLNNKIQNLKESDLITESDLMVASTIHKAKGLEFDYVILPNIVDGKLPFFKISNMRAGEEKTKLMEEQKRLLYVAMTRAKKQLVIGTYTNYSGRDRLEIQKQCDFIQSILPMMRKV